VRIAAALALVVCSTALVACGDEDEPAATTTATGLDAQAQPCPGADSPPNITEVTSYGTSCEAVEAALGEVGEISEEFVIGDFDCGRIEGDQLAGTWECRGEANYFTFKFAD